MALVLKFTIDNNCTSNLTFTDNTGEYSSPSNTGGWGTPNPDLGQIDASVLVIENMTTGVIYDPIDITPTDVVGTETIIDITDLEVSGVNQNLTALPDGLYTFTWTVSINDGTFYDVEQCITKLTLCQIECKIKTLAGNIDLGCGCCRDDCSGALWKFLEAYTLYKALCYGGACGSVGEINENIECLQDFLRNINCQNC